MSYRYTDYSHISFRARGVSVPDGYCGVYFDLPNGMSGPYYGTTDPTGIWNAYPQWGYLVQTDQYGNVTGLPPTTGSGDNGETTAALNGLVDNIKALIKTINDVLSGGLTTELESVLLMLQRLPTQLAQQSDDLKTAVDAQTAALIADLDTQRIWAQAIMANMDTDIANAIKDMTGQITNAIDTSNAQFKLALQTIDNDIQTVVKTQILIAQDEGNKTRAILQSLDTDISKAITASGDKVAESIRYLSTTVEQQSAQGSLLISGAIASITAALVSTTALVAKAGGGIALTVVKWVAILGAAVAIPTMVDFDKVKDIAAQVMEWLIMQQYDLSKRLYTKIKSDTGGAH